ncbi:hypothetical protein XELAEV_18040891mg [Xenopus laevis]|uniref:Uncharacterized protein n=1 Tax=Xenopus laevis TaxID=8355 RepID=A0A974CAL1_XENLA|nr:hypothetical protein XELAEV_18040891mg [Xenopus laevis]
MLTQGAGLGNIYIYIYTYIYSAWCLTGGKGEGKRLMFGVGGGPCWQFCFYAPLAAADVFVLETYILIRSQAALVTRAWAFHVTLLLPQGLVPRLNFTPDSRPLTVSSANKQACGIQVMAAPSEQTRSTLLSPWEQPALRH